MTNSRAATQSAETPLLVVAAALVGGDGRLLVQRRPLHKHHGGLWEFPGGKVEPGEAPEQALARELREELGIGVEPGDVIPEDFAINTPLVLLLYRIGRWAGQPRALEAGSRVAWHPPAALGSLAMPPADRRLAERLAARA